MNETRWPNSLPMHEQPYNDDVLAHLEDVLRDVVTLADSLKLTGIELLESFVAARAGDGSTEPKGYVLLEAILTRHTHAQLDADDLVFELIDLAGTPSNDNYND